MSKQDWQTIRSKYGVYPPEAYQFVREGLAHTVKMIHGDAAPTEEEGRHVSGRQLCLGLRSHAIEKYGLLAKTVLGRWGVRRTEDFGRIVFAMVEAGLMRKTDDDSLADFADVFDFDEAFGDLRAAHR